MNHLVKITRDDCGELKLDPKWCLVGSTGGLHAICTGEFFGYGESDCEYERKQVKKGGITCPGCLNIIKEFKAVKL